MMHGQKNIKSQNAVTPGSKIMIGIESGKRLWKQWGTECLSILACFSYARVKIKLLYLLSAY